MFGKITSAVFIVLFFAIGRELVLSQPKYMLQ